jgi:hypothetical protein
MFVGNNSSEGMINNRYFVARGVIEPFQLSGEEATKVIKQLKKTGDVTETKDGLLQLN